MATLHIVKHHTDAELQAKLKHAHDEAFKNRVKAVVLALQGKKRFEIVTQLCVDAKSVTTWIAKYNNGSIEALATDKGGRPEGNPKWNSDLFTTLATEIDKGGYWSIPRMQKWLKDTYCVDIPEQTVWYRMDKLDYSYKGARPHPVQADRERQATFKKGVLRHSWSR